MGLKYLFDPILFVQSIIFWHESQGLLCGIGSRDVLHRRKRPFWISLKPLFLGESFGVVVVNADRKLLDRHSCSKVVLSKVFVDQVQVTLVFTFLATSFVLFILRLLVICKNSFGPCLRLFFDRRKLRVNLAWGSFVRDNIMFQLQPMM